jgi:hypothetical protein
MLTLNKVSTSQQESARQKIDALDLEPIIFKLMLDEKGPQWTLEECDVYVNLYKKFLLLHLIYPENKLPPTKEIDWVWHFHILDTSKYMVDCDNIFGYYFHHFPYFGLRGSQDAQALAESFEITRTLFQEQFQIDLLALANVGSDAGYCFNPDIHNIVSSHEINLLASTGNCTLSAVCWPVDCVGDTVSTQGPGDISGMSELDKARVLALQERPRPERN